MIYKQTKPSLDDYIGIAILIVIAISVAFGSILIVPILLIVLYLISFALPKDSEPTYQPTPKVNFRQADMFMSAEEKRSYLKSTYWKTLREQRLNLANNKCEQCNKPNPTDLHHIHYHNLGADQINDVRMLCRECHQAIHDELGYDRKTQYKLHKFYSRNTQN